MTKFEALVAILSLVIGMLGTLIGVVWKARGWIDELRSTDERLARALETLTASQLVQYKETQRRLRTVERRLDSGPRAAPGFGYPQRSQ